MGGMKRSLILVSLLAACGGSAKPSDTTAPKTDKPAEATACNTNVCTTYGAAVPKVASDIVDKAATDAEFKSFFAPLVAKGDAAVKTFKDHLAQFIAVAYGCADPSTYQGEDMTSAHASLGITEKQYDDFIGLIAGVLEADGVPDGDVKACFAPPLEDAKFKAMIVTK